MTAERAYLTGAQMHLAELEKPDALNAMLPGLGRDWADVLGGSTLIFYNMVTYARGWEAVAAAWSRGEHALLAPTEPCWWFPLATLLNLLKEKVAKRELELCGTLSG